MAAKTVTVPSDSVKVGGIGAPYLMGRLGDDRPGVGMAGNGVGLARRGKQLVLAEQPEHPVLASAGALKTQAGPDLPVTFSGENGIQQELANLGHELLVGMHLLGTAFL